jgi:DNA-binding Lrp family transcriptional regulator
MPTAYVMVNCDLGIESEQKAINKLKNVSGVIDVSEVAGVYDIVVKVASDTFENLKETITRDIRNIDVVRSTMTLIVIK